MLADILTDTLQKLETYRENHPNNSEELNIRLEVLIHNIEHVLENCKEQEFEKSA